MSSSAASGNVRELASNLILSLPVDATWDDVQYTLYVRQQIELGLEDSAAGRIIDTDEMRQRLIRKKQGQANR